MLHNILFYKLIYETASVLFQIERKLICSCSFLFQPDRRQELVDKLFKNVLQKEQNKLHELLPARNTYTFNLRNMRKFKAAFKTNRFRSSFITFNTLKAWTVLVDMFFFRTYI